MKKSLLTLGIILSFISANSQDYLGLSTGNYAGIHGLMLQPANVADNRYKVDINFFSTNVGFQNNYIGISRSYLVNNRFSLKDYDTYQDFKNRVLQENSVKGNNVQLRLNNRINLPSVMITTGSKSGIAIGFQSRTALAVDNLNPAFAKQLYEEFQNAATYNQPYNLSGLNMNALTWFEGSFTYGRVLINEDKHFLKAGVTAKYLGGISSLYLNAENLNLTANNDSTISANGNSVRYGHSESDISFGSLNGLQPDANGFGFDAGIVYEFRGRIDKFKFLKYSSEDAKLFTSTRRDKNKYSFKVGVSLVDVGKLTFKSTPLARDFSTNVNNININNLNLQSVGALDTFISQNVNYLNNQTGQEYTVAMPTALSAQFDLHLARGFYINAMGYVPFKELNRNAEYRVFTPNYYAVTPRWESRIAGVYVPLTYNNNLSEKRAFNIGATLRVGPLFVGSSNMLSLLKQDNIQAANFHAGFKIPIAHGKPSKAANWFKKFTNEKEEEPELIEPDTDEELEPQEIKKEKVIIKEKTIEKTPPPAPTPPIQIIINNYNSAGNGKNDDQGQQQIFDVDPATRSAKERSTVVIKKVDPIEERYQNLEMRNLEQQIEFLQLKLRQKENLIDEIEDQQERIDDGTSSQESKKKIKSLKDDYLYNNDVEYIPTTVFDSTATREMQLVRINEMQRELAELANRNQIVDRKLALIETQNQEQMQSYKGSETEEAELEEVNKMLREIKQREIDAVQPPSQIVYVPVTENESLSKTGTRTQQAEQYPEDINRVQPTNTNDVRTSKEYQDMQAELLDMQQDLAAMKQRENDANQIERDRVVPVPVPAIENKTQATTRTIRDTVYVKSENNQLSVEKLNDENAISKADYENLQDELRNLRREMEVNRKIENNTTSEKIVTNKIIPVPVPSPQYRENNNVPTGRDTIYFERENNSDTTITPQIIRDTVMVDRPVEKIVRDTITNTIEKERVITKTEFKEVEVKVDNTQEGLLALPPYFVLYEVGSTNILKVYQERLNFYATKLRKYPNLRVALTGHADATGDAAKNLLLSKKRADAVRTYLTNKGVFIDQIKMEYDGEQKPMETNETKVGKSQNRRVEVVFFKY